MFSSHSSNYHCRFSIGCKIQFSTDTAVDKRLKSLRLILLSGSARDCSGCRGPPFFPEGDTGEAGGVSPRPEGAAPLGPGSGSPLVYAGVSGAGPSAHGVAAGGADGLSSAASGDEVDVEEFARAKDEPLLTARREGSPCPMDADTGKALLGCLGGSGDETMPTADPLATLRASRGMSP